MTSEQHRFINNPSHKKKVAVYERTVPTRTSMVSPLWRFFGEGTQFFEIEKAVFFFRFRWLYVLQQPRPLCRSTSPQSSPDKSLCQKESPDRHRITNLFHTGWNLTNHITKRANIPDNACGLQVQCERCFFFLRQSRVKRVSRATDWTPFGCALRIK